MKVPIVEVMAPNQSRRKSRYCSALKVRAKRDRAASPMMGMTDRYRQRIRGIHRHRAVTPVHQQPHHLGDLLLLRGAVADDRALHASRSVLEDPQSRSPCAEQDDAARVRELDEAL